MVLGVGLPGCWVDGGAWLLSPSMDPVWLVLLLDMQLVETMKSSVSKNKQKVLKHGTRLPMYCTLGLGYAKLLKSQYILNLMPVKTKTIDTKNDIFPIDGCEKWRSTN